MIHVYNNITGQFVELLPEGNEPNFVGDEFTAVIGAPRVEREEYIYVGGELIKLPVVAINADKPTITADGVDAATVTVEVSGVEPLPSSIDVVLTDGAGASEHTIPLTDGQSAAYPVTAEQPTTLTIRAKDQATYYDAGGITITAVEA